MDHRLQLSRTAPPFMVGIIKDIYNVVFQTSVGSRLRLLLVTRQNSKTWGTNTLASSERLQQPTALFPFRVPYRHVGVSVEILQQGRSWLLVQLLSNFHSRLIFSLYMGLYISLPPPHFLRGFRFKLCGSSETQLPVKMNERKKREMKKRKKNKIK